MGPPINGIQEANEKSNKLAPRESKKKKKKKKGMSFLLHGDILLIQLFFCIYMHLEQEKEALKEIVVIMSDS